MRNTKQKVKLVITKKWLQKHGACKQGINWFKAQKDKSLSIVIKKLIQQEYFDWANWTITKFMNHKQNVQYACLSALESLKNFESVYPNDKRPREAIQAALKWALNPTEENKSTARSAELAARSAAGSAELAAELAGSAAELTALSAELAARSAAGSAGLAAESARAAKTRDAARSAAGSAGLAAESAWSAELAARSAAWSVELAAESARSARLATWKKILLYGLKIVLKQIVINSVDKFMEGY